MSLFGVAMTCYNPTRVVVRLPLQQPVLHSAHPRRQLPTLHHLAVCGIVCSSLGLVYHTLGAVIGCRAKCEIWMTVIDKLIDQIIYHNRVRGPMARRLTTNQEIAGSIPAVLISFCFLLRVCQTAVNFFFCYLQTS
jgi:hypothetical protein